MGGPRCVGAALLLTAVTFQPAAGQWWGTVFDKIGEWSGPRMQYYGVTYRVGYQPTQRLDLGQIDSLRIRLMRFEQELRNRSQSFQQTVVRPVGQSEPTQRMILDVQLTDTCIRAIRDRLSPLAAGYDESVVDAARRDLSQLNDRLDDLDRPRGGVAEAELLRSTACHRRDELATFQPDTIDARRSSGWVLRFGLFTGNDTRNDDKDVDGALRGTDVYGFMVKNTLEYNWTVQNTIAWDPLQWLLDPLRWLFPDVGLGVEGGLNAHYVHGDISPFWYPTFPLAVNFYPFARRPSRFLRNAKIGIDVHVLPPDQPHAYAEIPEYRQTRWHFSDLGWFIGLDLSLDQILDRRPYE
jgi:hypothetical protein